MCMNMYILSVNTCATSFDQTRKSLPHWFLEVRYTASFMFCSYLEIDEDIRK